MRWNIKRSIEIQERIAKDEGLMRQLSNSVDEILKKHGIKLKGISYVFEPRVFKMAKNEESRILLEARKALASALVSDASTDGYIDKIDLSRFRCLPECGIVDRLTLDKFERLRLSGKEAADDPIPLDKTVDFMRLIIADRSLLSDLSDRIFGLIKEHGIELNPGEGCVFTPSIFETPVFAQQVGIIKESQRLQGFSPQILEDPTPEPASLRIKPFPGIIMHEKWDRPTVGIFWPPWWWKIGLPSPEILHALDVMRDMDKSRR